MARATVTLAGPNYAVEIDAGRHHLVGDEGPNLGGQDKGPAPYEYLLAALGSCTIITLKMYADRKDWPLTGARVSLHYQGGEAPLIERTLHIDGDLDETQRARLADIAERTPVTLTLKNGLRISTTLAPDERRAHIEAELDEALEESFPASDPPKITRPGGHDMD